MTFLWEPIQFLVELLLAEVIFTFCLKRQRHFLLRLALCLASLFAAAVFWPVQWMGLVKMVKYLMLFILSVLATPILFQCSGWEALYRASAAYAAQHIAFNWAGMLSFLLKPDLFQPYSLADHACSALCFLCVYCLVYFTVARRIRREEPVGVDNHDRLQHRRE